MEKIEIETVDEMGDAIDILETLSGNKAYYIQTRYKDDYDTTFVAYSIEPMEDGYIDAAIEDYLK